MSSLPSLVLLVIFVVSAGAIWGAGIRLSDYTDVLAERLHLGAALGGVILLAIATNLPEIAITVSAALSGHVEVAVGNPCQPPGVPSDSPQASMAGCVTAGQRLVGHSHSIVPGGLLVTSSTTRLTSGTSLVMRVEMIASTS
jgi:hypothetical protein